MNWLDFCYSDQFAVGFDTTGGGTYKNCFCWGYSDKEPLHLAVRSRNPFFGLIDTMTVGGKQHPDHTNQFMESDAVSELAVLHNIILLTKNGKPQVIK